MGLDEECTHLFGNTLVIPPSVAANTARKPYLNVRWKQRQKGASNQYPKILKCTSLNTGWSHSRVQIFILPHFLNQLSDDARVQNEVVKEQIVTWHKRD